MLLSSRPSGAPSRRSFPGAGERARLSIEGVRAPIVTRVARRREDALVVTQELPFLRIGSRVLGEDGRAARIARVAVDCETDVPTLVLELAYDEIEVEVEDPIDRGWDRRDQTLTYGEQRTTSAAPGASIAKREESGGRESTLVFRTLPPVAAARNDPSERTSKAWMTRPGSDVELWWRETLLRIEAAIDHVVRGLAQALQALRTDP